VWLDVVAAEDLGTVDLQVNVTVDGPNVVVAPLADALAAVLAREPQQEKMATAL
jgi:hypothetical protein